MNYRHAFHAGNYADVFKHVFLLRLLRALQRKAKGFLYLDTHAGRGVYDLASAAAGPERTPEWPAGIGRLWQERSCRRRWATMWRSCENSTNVAAGRRPAALLPRFAVDRSAGAATARSSGVLGAAGWGSPRVAH